MLDNPQIPQSLLLSFIGLEYQLEVTQVEFLPIGADINTAVFRMSTRDGTDYFLKLRKGVFADITVTVPQFLHENGISVIIPPLKTCTGRLWGELENYKAILYPFIKGKDAYSALLTDQQWVNFGAALKKIHSVKLPLEIKDLVPHESFLSRWRDEVRDFQVQVEENVYSDPAAKKMAAFMKTEKKLITRLVEYTSQLGRELQSQTLEFVLCHCDMHPGNILLSGDESFFIVDWDNPMLAPKEHDLTAVGGGLASLWHSPREEGLFYQGYGQVNVDRKALAYFRCERIIQDIAAFSEQLLLSDEGGEDREQGYQYFISNFLVDHEIEIALNTLK
jgi:spectinomycin phosphotransferase